MNTKHLLRRAAALSLSMLMILIVPLNTFAAEKETTAAEGRFVRSTDKVRFRLSSGAYAEGMLLYKDIRYYFDPDTQALLKESWLELDGEKYYADQNGILLTGVQQIDGETCYFGADSALCKEEWFDTDDGRYYFDADGERVVGWLELENAWYYLSEADKKMVFSDWVLWNDRWYYLDENGVMAENTWVDWKDDWYYCGEGGSMLTETTVTTGGREWYVDASGRLEVSPKHPLDVPVIKQHPELPNGCEITALTQLLRYHGFGVSHTTMAADYLPRQPLKWENRKKTGPDPYYYFVNNPEDDTGWYCLEGAIIVATNNYLKDQGSNMRAKRITGATIEEIHSYLKDGYPVMVWLTPDFEPFGYSSVRWTLPNGELYKPYIGTHGLIVTGIDMEKQRISFSDPAYGKHTRSFQFFLNLYEKMGCRAVVIQ